MVFNERENLEESYFWYDFSDSVRKIRILTIVLALVSVSISALFCFIFILWLFKSGEVEDWTKYPYFKILIITTCVSGIFTIISRILFKIQMYGEKHVTKIRWKWDEER